LSLLEGVILPTENSSIFDKQSLENEDTQSYHAQFPPKASRMEWVIMLSFPRKKQQTLTQAQGNC
jgi:hypothetical protein